MCGGDSREVGDVRFRARETPNDGPSCTDIPSLHTPVPRTPSRTHAFHTCLRRLCLAVRSRDAGVRACAHEGVSFNHPCTVSQSHALLIFATRSLSCALSVPHTHTHTRFCFVCRTDAASLIASPDRLEALDCVHQNIVERPSFVT